MWSAWRRGLSPSLLNALDLPKRHTSFLAPILFGFIEFIMYKSPISMSDKMLVSPASPGAVLVQMSFSDQMQTYNFTFPYITLSSLKVDLAPKF